MMPVMLGLLVMLVCVCWLLAWGCWLVLLGMLAGDAGDAGDACQLVMLAMLGVCLHVEWHSIQYA